MKVYMGPYRTDRVRIYAIFDNYMSWKHKKPYWSIDDEEYTRTDKLLEKFFDVLQEMADATINKILEKRSERKIKVRVDPYDVWSMDNTLAYIIHPMLVELKKRKQGGPFVPDEEVPEHLRSTNAKPVRDNEVDEFYFDRWDWVLDEMIWTFKTLNEDWESQFYISSSKEDDYLSGTYDAEGRQKMQDRINNGLRLFGKYYQSLWD